MSAIKVLVTGAAGQYGTFITKEFTENFDFLGTYHSNKSNLQQNVNYINLDIENFDKTNSVINDFKPNFVLHQHSLINALAQKYVPEMKKDIKYYQVGPNVMNCSLSTDEKQLYLWIKKDCTQMVQSFFKFRIDD